jgi:hypothetical protein
MTATAIAGFIFMPVELFVLCDAGSFSLFPVWLIV